MIIKLKVEHKLIKHFPIMRGMMNRWICIHNKWYREDEAIDFNIFYPTSIFDITCIHL